MSDQIKQDMEDSAIYDNLITRLTTLKLILEDIDKVIIFTNNKIKQLESEKVDELELLEEELLIRTLRNRFLGRANNDEEEIDSRRQTKKKIDNVKTNKKRSSEGMRT